MIIEDIISAINTQLALTSLFDKSWSLCELIHDADGNKFPAYYKGVSEYDRAVNDWDAKVGVSYIRKNGDVSYNEISTENQIADCAPQVEMNVPLKIVCIVPKEHIPRDDEFSDDYVALKVISVLNGEENFITDADSSVFIVANHTTDNEAILNEEFAGITPTDVHYKYAYLSVQLTAKIIIATSCLDPTCTPCYYN